VLVFSVAGAPSNANARGASDTTSIFIRGFPTMLTEFARGNDGDIFSENESKLLKKDATIRFQIHYHPNGKTAVKGDQVRVGIKFFPKGYQPKHVVQTMALASPTTLAIAPGDPNSRSDAYFTLTQPSRLVSYQPHMHYRGKRMVLEAILPTGQVETLTDVNRFVWTWQITYPYKHQPAFPKGTVLHSIAYHDNSAGNKENPDPTAFIGWGDRTVDDEHRLAGFLRDQRSGIHRPAESAAAADRAAAQPQVAAGGRRWPVVIRTPLVRCVMVIAALAALAETPGTAAPQSRPQPKSPRLYVFDCGTLEGDPARFNLKREEMITSDMSVACYLVVHPNGSLMWDTGAVPDADVKNENQRTSITSSWRIRTDT
jgi:hypothetical protein